MITKEQILEANQTGLDEVDTGYYTPVLRVAYNLGLKGISLQNAETATCFRFGKAPENFISWNYAENTCENGLSVYTEKSIIRSEFLGRQNCLLHTKTKQDVFILKVKQNQFIRSLKIELGKMNYKH